MYKYFSLTLLTTLSVSSAALGGSAVPQEQMRRQAPGRTMAEYDPSQEKTVRGAIVRTYMGPLNDLFIVEITVDGSALHLFLGPAEAVAKHKFAFTPGAPIEAIGMPGFKVNGGPAMLTRQVKSGKQTLTLRDASGKPTWSD